MDILDHATSWNAVLLIDEADVFLEERTNHDLQRNGLVSVFLRLLEYYEGIMFLTTNRVGTVDDAFKSRIHLAIKYPSLSAASQASIWTTFITKDGQRPKPVWLTEYLSGLAAEQLNGRYIKNIMRTAFALAKAAGRELEPSDIDVGVRAMKEFEHDFVNDPKAVG